MKKLVLKIRLKLELLEEEMLKGTDFEEFRNKLQQALEDRVGQIILRTDDAYIKQILVIDRAFISEMYQKIEDVKK